MNAGNRTAHSRAGKYPCMGLDVSKKGYELIVDGVNGGQSTGVVNTDEENRPRRVVGKHENGSQEHRASEKFVAQGLCYD